MKLVNVGCGSVFHPAWINLDLVPAVHGVKCCDFRRGIPYPDNYFNVCYSSHVIEHLKKTEAKNLIGECWRVLKTNGVIRIVVPDLEKIARTYLFLLEQAESGIAEAIPNYDWIMLELYDQVVRQHVGGEMQTFFCQDHILNESFIRSRIGLEYDSVLQKISNKSKQNYVSNIRTLDFSRALKKIKYFSLSILIKLVAGTSVNNAFQEGLFRNSGEIHLWMYDRFSLRRLLEEAGFVEVQLCSASQSRILNFSRYELDIAKGHIRKPDSLFMEGIKR
jgi:predicted SAM-dependent methyltransferase